MYRTSLFTNTTLPELRDVRGQGADDSEKFEIFSTPWPPGDPSVLTSGPRPASLNRHTLWKTPLGHPLVQSMEHGDNFLTRMHAARRPS